MSVQHKALRDEVLFHLGRASAPLDSGQIYERCELADEMKQVSNALFHLKDAGKIVRDDGEGRARYILAAGTAAPAPAGKAGRPGETPPAPASVLADFADATGRLTVGYGVPPVLEPGEESLSAISAAVAAKRVVKDHVAGAGNMVHLPDQTASAERMADSMLTKARAQLSAQIDTPHALRWWVDQDGGIDIAVGDDFVSLTRLQAARMATVLLAVHEEIETQP